MRSSSKVVFKRDASGVLEQPVSPLPLEEIVDANAPDRTEERHASSEQFQSLIDSDMVGVHIEESPAGMHGDSLSEQVPDKLREEVLAEAREEAETMVKQAQDKADLIEREAYERGYAQGEKTGIEIAEKQFQTAIKSMRTALADFKKNIAQNLADMESEVVRLALAVARRVLHVEVLLNADVIVENLKHVFRMVTDKDSVVIRLNPVDVERARIARDKKEQGFHEFKDIAFEPDESIPRGGAVVETNFGNLDARVEEQLKIVETSVLSALEKRTDEESGHGTG